MNAPALKIAPAPEKPAALPPAAPLVDASKRKLPIRKILLGAVALIVLGLAGNYGYHWATFGRFQISTDDAYVKTDMSQLGAKLSGYVASIPAEENARVKEGDVILKLDDGDYRLAIEAAAARIETQKASIETVAQQVTAQQSQIASALAQVDSAKAAEINAVLTQNRASQLVKNNAGSQQSYDDANRLRAVAAANVSIASAAVDQARAQIAIFNAKTLEAQSILKELEIALAKAQRDLSFTEIRAPFDGIVANRAVEPGQYVAPGTRLMALVPTQSSYVEANFKETQIGEIHAGQKASIIVDALGGETYEGKVLSIAPASGAEFSLLPPENATGNFTKITQRLPVKIAVPPELAAKLVSGLSVRVEIDSRDTGQ
jgi:membrane fusion protein, multidrug efflux system